MNILEIGPFLSAGFPSLTQAATAGTVVVSAFCIFEYLKGFYTYGSTAYKITEFLADVGLHATIWTGIITTLVAAQKRWPMLSFLGGTTWIGFSILEKAATYIHPPSKKDNEPILINNLCLIGIAINTIATSYLLYKQPSAARIFHWLAAPIAVYLSYTSIPPNSTPFVG